MTRVTEQPIRPHPDTTYQILPYPDPKPTLPAGHGGLAVRTWFRQRLLDRRSRNVPLPPMIGVDGQPALWGWGTALVVVRAGQHLVQAQLNTTEAERMVTVAGGEIVTLEYAAPRNTRGRGVLGPPGQRQVGIPVWNTWAATFLGGWTLVNLVDQYLYPLDAFAFPVAAAAPAAYIGTVLVKRHLDRRARRRANGPAVPVPAPAADQATYVLATGQPSTSPGEARLSRSAPSASAMAPHFLGAAPPPDPPTGWGAVVLTSSFLTSVVRVGRISFWSPLTLSTWTPPPAVRVDGQYVPASWSTWWYPLRPGMHTIDVVEPAAARLRVEVAAGTTQYVHCRAHVHVRRDHTERNVIGEQAEVTLRLDRPRVGRSKATRTRVLA